MAPKVARSPVKAGSVEPGPFEACPDQPGPDEPGPGQIGLAKVRNFLARLSTPIPFRDPFRPSLEQPQRLVAVHDFDLPAATSQSSPSSLWPSRMSGSDAPHRDHARDRTVHLSPAPVEEDRERANQTTYLR